MSHAETTEEAGPLIGILACDHVAADLAGAARDRDFDAMYAEMLQRADPGVRVRTYDVVGGESPSDPGECDGWVITGARHDAYRDQPWLVALRAFIGRLHESNSRAVGVCFGHQVVAHALGGRAAPTGTWTAGPQLMTVDATPWFEGGTVHLNAMHRDVVATLPPGARLIGRGTTAEIPVYLIGDTILCIQDHPEFDAGFVAALVERRRDLLGEAGATETLERLRTVDTEVGNATVGRWLLDFLLDRRIDRSTAR